MHWRVGDGSGRSTRRSTRAPAQAMTDAAWKDYFADFLEQSARRFLARRSSTTRSGSPAAGLTTDHSSIVRQVKAADLIGLERGFNDAGLTAAPAIGRSTR